jgi:glycosyltransferase involved in cell wall biosynthesis
MRIALLATSAVTVPPKVFGGAEVVTAELAKMLTRLGHDVVVYGAGDSRPGCALRYRFPHADGPGAAGPQRELLHAAYAFRDIAASPIPFDVIHASHATALAVGAATRTPIVFTVHHDRDESLLQYYGDFPDVCYVATSDSQVRRMPELNVTAVIHPGLDPETHAAGTGSGDYFAFLGKLTPERAAHLALDAACSAGARLHLGAAAQDGSAPYFEEEILPRLQAAGDMVQWLGDLSFDRKLRLLQNARALLVPLAYEEPTGLSMMEAMLVGTPVIAFDKGCASELIEDGVTGFVVKSALEMATRMKQIGALSRTKCRERAIERWSSIRMATAYEGIYEALLRARGGRRQARALTAGPRLTTARRIAAPGHSWNGLFSPLWEV